MRLEYHWLKKPFLVVVIGGGLSTLFIFLTFTFLPVISPTEKYSISVNPIMIKDDMGIETHVEIKNTGIDSLTNVKVDYGGTAKPDVILLLHPGEKITLSPPTGSNLEDVKVTTDQEIEVVEPYNIPVSTPFPCAASC